MNFKSISLAALLGTLFFILVSGAEGRDLVSIRRVRSVPNPAPEAVPGEEMLEVTFSLVSPRWVENFGWSLKYYDGEKELLDEETEAYIDPGRNRMARIRGRSFKGGTVFTLLFPLREAAGYLVLALGDGVQREVILYPYTALLEDFNIPAPELDAAITRLRLIVLED
ncbi:MAG: hypothetical protein P9M08_03815 [Candidatus Erginobacter occultus]|nr:hypothetical protein [Candidatus Erginobacter occultus]